MRVLDLFSGIGGFSLGLERAGMQTIAFCEPNEFCQAVLRKHWPDTPIFDDVRLLKGGDVGPVDVICGGFPCQDISNAGRRAGLNGKHSSLWSEMFRLITELGPQFVIAENSSQGRRHYLETVLSDLRSIGYEAAPMEIAAYDLGANHERRRCWILADAGSGRRWMEEEALRAGWQGAQFHSWWASEPAIPRVDDGVSDRVDRCRALGNSLVPQIPEFIGRAIMSSQT